MTLKTRIFIMVLGWTGVITGLHLRYNFDWSEFMNDRLPEDQRKLNVAYIPVT